MKDFIVYDNQDGIIDSFDTQLEAEQLASDIIKDIIEQEYNLNGYDLNEYDLHILQSIARLETKIDWELKSKLESTCKERK